jgi:GlpG protein
LRQIGTIADERQAKRLADHLLTLGITTRLDPGPSGTLVWVHREEKVEQAKQEFAAFQANPDDAKFAGKEAAARALRKEAEKKQREHQRNTIFVQNQWAAYRPPRRCPLTFALIAMSLGLTIFGGFGHSRAVDRFFIANPHSVQSNSDLQVTDEYTSVKGDVEVRSNVWKDLRRGEVWRLVTPIFLHFSGWHLFFNMMWLYDIGGLIEMRRGTLRYALFVLSAAVITNLGQYYYNYWPAFGGMSGVNYAFLGYLWMKKEYEPEAGLGLRRDTIILMLAWLVICMTGYMGPVANAAHFVGLGLGVIYGVAPHMLKDLRRT